MTIKEDLLESIESFLKNERPWECQIISELPKQDVLYEEDAFMMYGATEREINAFRLGIITGIDSLLLEISCAGGIFKEVHKLKHTYLRLDKNRTAE